MFFMIIVRIANALKDSFDMSIERLDIQYNKKLFMYCGYLTLKENERIIEFKIFTNGEVERLTDEMEVGIDV